MADGDVEGLAGDDVDRLARGAEALLAAAGEVAALGEGTFTRVAYLGSGPLAGLAQEAALKLLELTAGAPKYAKTARGTWSTNAAIRKAERELAEQAEASYRRMLKDRQAAAPARTAGASVTAERA